MTIITISNPEDDLKRRLRIRVAAHSRSLEEGAREVLRRASPESTTARNLAATIHSPMPARVGAKIKLTRVDMFSYK